MYPLEKNSNIFGGMGKDGIWRTCKFQAKKDTHLVPDGTAKAILVSLGFKGVKDIKYTR